MPYGFWLKAVGKRGLQDRKQSLAWIDPDIGYEHDLQVRVSTDEDTSTSLLTVFGRGFASEHEARAVGRRVRASLRFAALLSDVPIDLGTDWTSTREVILQRTWDVAIDGRAHHLPIPAEELKQGATVIGDGVGLLVFEGHGGRLIVAGGGSVQVWAGKDPLTDPIGRLEAGVEGAPEDGSKLALALDLYLQSHLESGREVRFLNMVTSLEVCADRQDLPPRVLRLRDEFQAVVRAERQALGNDDSGDIRSLESLLSWLGNTRESISDAIMRVAFEAVGDSTYSGRSLDRFVRHLYGTRSRLIHDGIVPEDLRSLTDDVNRLTRGVLQALADGAGPS